MPTYIQLLKWTDQGRKDAGSIADRVDEVVPTGRQLPAGWHSRGETKL